MLGQDVARNPVSRRRRLPWRSLAGVWFLAVGGVALFAQTPQAPRPPAALPATGVIAGTVTAAETGQPLRKAQVRLVSTTPVSTRTVTTDDAGHFQFTAVPAGSFTLSASKGGYLDMIFGARRPGTSIAGTPIQLAVAQKLDRVDLQLPKGSVITGTVVDEFGDPAFNTAVRVMRFVYGYGEKYATTFGQQDFTDDRGSYRIAGLMPGEYIVSAVPKDVVSQVMATNDMLRDQLARALAAARAAGRESSLNYRPDAESILNQPIDPRGYVPVHYPGSVLASGAASVRVGLNDEVSGIDIRLQVVHTASVTGTVTLAAGEVPAGARIQLMDPLMPMPTLGSWWTGLKPGARFTFYGVAPGSYVVRVSTSSAGSDLFAAADVSVDPSRNNDIELALVRGATVSGVIALEGAPVALSRLHVVLEPVIRIADPEISSERAVVDAAGRFVVRGLAPTVRYRISIEGLPAGWRLGSAVFGDRDAVDQLLEIQGGANLTGGVLKLTSTSAEIAGAVTDNAGRRVTNAVVILFPEDRRLWVPRTPRIQTAPLSADGRYVVRGLPAGDYRIVVADPEPNQWFDVGYLTEMISAATAIVLGPGEKKQQDFRIK